MKTTTYLFAVGLLTLGISTAKAQKVELGVTAGPSVATLYGNNDVEDALDARLGFVAGGTFQYNFNPTLGLHTGLLFERKGGYDRDEYTFLGTEYVTRTTVNFDYLTLPVLLRANFLPEGGPRLFVNVGPYFGFLLHQSTIIRTTNDDGDKEVNKTVNTDSYKAFDIGLSAGLGVRIPVATNMGLGIEVRDNVGLYNFSESDADEDRLKNNSLVFLVSLNFAIGQ